MPESPPGVAFRHANFRYYLMVRVLTTTASEMQAVAVAWQLYALTHRPLDLGLVGLAQFLPGILLFLVAGQTADRFARRATRPPSVRQSWRPGKWMSSTPLPWGSVPLSPAAAGMPGSRVR